MNDELTVQLDTALGLVPWGSQITHEARSLMVKHAVRALEVNEKMNLTRITAPEEVAVKHLLDSLWLLPALASWGPALPRRYLDVGSGGGWPFVPLAAAFSGMVKRFTGAACDKTQKKAAFLAEICRDLLPGCEVISKQMREIHKGSFDLVTARAVGPMGDLVAECGHTLDQHGVIALYKGPSATDEVPAFRNALRKLRYTELPVFSYTLPGGDARQIFGAKRG